MAVGITFPLKKWFRRWMNTLVAKKKRHLPLWCVKIPTRPFHGSHRSLKYELHVLPRSARPTHGCLRSFNRRNSSRGIPWCWDGFLKFHEIYHLGLVSGKASFRLKPQRGGLRTSCCPTGVLEITFVLDWNTTFPATREVRSVDDFRNPPVAPVDMREFFCTS